MSYIIIISHVIGKQRGLQMRRAYIEGQNTCFVNEENIKRLSANITRKPWNRVKITRKNGRANVCI